jgi:hypothetical protein
MSPNIKLKIPQTVEIQEMEVALVAGTVLLHLVSLIGDYIYCCQN